MNKIVKSIILAVLCALILLCTCACGQDHSHGSGYAGAPAVYNELLDMYSIGLDLAMEDSVDAASEQGQLPCPTKGMEDRWLQMLRDAKANFPNVDKQAFGYITYDFNSDGINELILVRSDYYIMGIATAIEGNAVLLDAFSNSYRCVITEAKQFFTMDMTQGNAVKYAKRVLGARNSLLSTVAEFGQDAGVYYEMIDGDIYSSSEARVDQLIQEDGFDNAEFVTKLNFNVMQ